MRIDKYLKVSRIIKRRTVANEVCDNGRVSVGGRPVKASYDVRIGDVVTVCMGAREIRFEVLAADETSTKELSREMYRML